MRMVLRPWDGEAPPLTPEHCNVFVVEFWLGEKLRELTGEAPEEEKEAVVELVAQVIEGFVMDHWTGDSQVFSNGEKTNGQKLTLFTTVAKRLTDKDGHPLSPGSPFVAVAVASDFANRARNLVGSLV